MKVRSLLYLLLIFYSPLNLAAQDFEVPQLFATAIIEDGLDRPVDITFIPGDTTRLFILEQIGRIRVYDLMTEALLPDPYLDITSIVRSTGWEQGLLGLAFHPDFLNNGQFYVNYTSRAVTGVADGATVIALYQIPDPMANTGAGGGARLMTINQPFSNHNGGGIKFGPDGYLYIGTGDGGSAGDPDGNAQNPLSRLGKMLRIDIDFTGSALYGIPAGNPFQASGDTLGEIWAMGMRNPWRFSFDRQTGDLFIADVGQSAREEINFEPADSPGGLDYGWDCREGDIGYSGASADCDADDVYVDPVLAINHSLANSITGGTVYRGETYSAMQGWYFSADYLTDRWFLLRQRSDGSWQDEMVLVPGISRISSFGEDASGELYATDHNQGAIYRIGADPLSSTPVLTGDADRLRLYPNPAEDQINIYLDDQEPGDMIAELYDSQGRRVLQHVWPEAAASFQGSWQVQGMAAGSYQLRVQRGGRVYTRPLIIR